MSINITDNEKYLDILIWLENVSSLELFIRAGIIPFIPAFIIYLIS